MPTLEPRGRRHQAVEDGIWGVTLWASILPLSAPVGLDAAVNKIVLPRAAPAATDARRHRAPTRTDIVRLADCAGVRRAGGE